MPDAVATDLVERTAHLFQVIAHPVRLLVLTHLECHGPLSAGELQERLRIEASLLSHHLRLLRDARLVRAEPRGRHRIYRLEDTHVASIVRDALQHVAET